MEKTRERTRGLSVMGATFPMIGSIMGSGVLKLSSAVELSGYLLALPTLGAISAMCAFTLFQLVHCAKTMSLREKSYFEVCRTASPALGYFAEACIGAQGLGCCLVNFLIMKDWLALLLNVKIEKNLLYNILLTVILMIGPAVMSSFKDLKKLGFASIMCTVSVLYLSLLVLSAGILTLVLPTPVGVESAKDSLISANWNIGALFASLSKYIYALGCQQNMVRVFSLMDKPTVTNGTKAGSFAVAISMLIYFLVSVGGYVATGNNQKGSILDLLEDKTRPFYQLMEAQGMLGTVFFKLITLAKIGMIIVLYAAYPIQMHPTRDSILVFLRPLPVMGDMIRDSKRKVDVLITTTVSVLIALTSLTGVKYEFVMGLLGNTASCYIMFLLPSIAYLFSPKQKTAFSGISGFIIAFSIMVSVYGTYLCIVNRDK